MKESDAWNFEILKTELRKMHQGGTGHFLAPLFLARELDQTG